MFDMFGGGCPHVHVPWAHHAANRAGARTLLSLRAGARKYNHCDHNALCAEAQGVRGMGPGLPLLGGWSVPLFSFRPLPLVLCWLLAGKGQEAGGRNPYPSPPLVVETTGGGKDVGDHQG